MTAGSSSESPFQVFECPRGLRVVMEDVVEAMCPFTGARDRYKLTVDYISSGRCIEALSFSSWLEGFRPVKISQEDLTLTLLSEVKKLISPRRVCVSLAGSHGSLSLATEYCEGEG